MIRISSYYSGAKHSSDTIGDSIELTHVYNDVWRETQFSASVPAEDGSGQCGIASGIISLGHPIEYFTGFDLVCPRPDKWNRYPDKHLFRKVQKLPVEKCFEQFMQDANVDKALTISAMKHEIARLQNEVQRLEA